MSLRERLDAIQPKRNLTVAELIEGLREMPPDAEVYGFTEDFGSRYVQVSSITLQASGDVELGED